VLAEHDQADRQRRRHHEAQWPPEPRPEGDRDQEADLGHAGGPGVQERFENEIGEQLEDDEQPHHESRSRPAVEHREAHEYRRDGANPRSDVGDEAQGRGEDRPQQGVRHADEEQPDAHADAEAQVDERLDQQVTADPLGRLVESTGRARQVAVTEHANDAVSQFLTIEEHEHDEDRDAIEAVSRRSRAAEQGGSMATDCIRQVTFEGEGFPKPVVARFDLPDATACS
jgi:hypothetical protein